MVDQKPNYSHNWPNINGISTPSCSSNNHNMNDGNKVAEELQNKQRHYVVETSANSSQRSVLNLSSGVVEGRKTHSSLRKNPWYPSSRLILLIISHTCRVSSICLFVSSKKYITTLCGLYVISLETDRVDFNSNLYIRTWGFFIFPTSPSVSTQSYALRCIVHSVTSDDALNQGKYHEIEGIQSKQRQQSWRGCLRFRTWVSFESDRDWDMTSLRSKRKGR